MEEKKQQNVTIKGTKDGLTLHLDDCCAFSELLQELDEKLSTHYYDGDGRSLIEVHAKVGNRYLTEVQQEELRTLVRNKKNLVVDSIESDVITKAEAVAWKEETEIVPVSKIVRSGQVLHVKGNLLLIGDVNPGGTVIAGGNIFVIGALRGIAHAGYYGDAEAVIAASVMNPMQLRISDVTMRAPEEKEDGADPAECAYIDENNHIVVDRLQLLTHLRPNLTKLERGIV
ncbi:septum site-determining protein MinC [Bacillus sp. DX1.1]|uniref:septum site-determining protein MinC n=1 Tax=unclassified Bacillus (in: firmicutes) TaxID=185979 RepID=UPI0025701235|nr:MULTISPECIES: septum site-determining protein MinC [unclassified Bacillus (in: firmicutes)]MDM5156642.1 septum site-determining protein MinC [Bacillus sp. DX1.1]WJE80899.1 septum site-determining protein MinC [Bacillus sp. DX3.1]